MPAPSIFISSTFYDLRYIRENLRFFVRSLGYNPILSEQGTVFFDPQQSAVEAAVSEVANSQIFVLIIGGRYGTALGDTEQSVTNAEYQEAVVQGIPVYALVEAGTLADYEVWRANQSDEDIDSKAITFPNADDARIFEFIDEVRSQTANNAMVAFQDFGNIEAYLRQQWAALLHAFLTRLREDDRVAETLGGLERISRRVEILSTQILESVGTKEAKLLAEMYDRMMGSSAVQDLTTLQLRPSPIDVLKDEDFFACARRLGGEWRIAHEDDPEMEEVSTRRSGQSGEMSHWHAAQITSDYAELREDLTELLSTSGVTLSELESRVAGGIDPDAV